MLYEAEVAVYSEMNTKHTHTHTHARTHTHTHIYIYIYLSIYSAVCTMFPHFPAPI